MSKLDKYLEHSNRRRESDILMNKLNLSEEFREFKIKQDQEHLKTMDNFDKVQKTSLIVTAVGALGLAGVMITGAVTAPVLIAGIAAVYSVGGIGLGAKLGEMFSNNKHEKDYGTSKAFLKELDNDYGNMGSEFYDDFVEKISKDQPLLSRSISEISKKFSNKKQELKENLVLSAEDNALAEISKEINAKNENCGLKREEENTRRRKIGL